MKKTENECQNTTNDENLPLTRKQSRSNITLQAELNILKQL